MRTWFSVRCVPALCLWQIHLTAYRSALFRIFLSLSLWVHLEVTPQNLPTWSDSYRSSFGMSRYSPSFSHGSDQLFPVLWRLSSSFPNRSCYSSSKNKTKPFLDPNKLKNYRTVSNRSFISNIIEKNGSFSALRTSLLTTSTVTFSLSTWT